MATTREFLVEWGLAEPGRGRLSKDAHRALEIAREQGVIFDDDIVQTIQFTYDPGL